MIDPYEHKLLDLIELEENEAAFSACIVTFATDINETYLIVGSAKVKSLYYYIIKYYLCLGYAFTP